MAADATDLQKPSVLRHLPTSASPRSLAGGKGLVPVAVRRFADVLLCIAGVLVGSCGEATLAPADVSDPPPPSQPPPPPNRVVEVVVSPASAELQPGEVLQLSAVAFDTAGLAIDTASFTWTVVGHPAVSVSADGRVTALEAGSLSIRASFGGVIGTSAIVVTLPRFDIGVAYISRSPRIPPPESRDEPVEAGWPAPGQTVTWEAHVFNRGRSVAEAVPWVWRIDGVEELAGTVDLPPGETVVALSRAWAFEHRQITFAVTPPPEDLDPELDELTVWSDALSLGLWVSQSVYDWMRLPGGPPAWEWWARRESDAWNETLEDFSSDVIPEGVLVRMRLDRLEVLPDGVLYPPDRDTDLYWSFPRDAPVSFMAPHRQAWRDQTVVLHELLHQRGLTDIYAYDVWHDGENRDVRILDPGGRLAVGSTRMPFIFPWSSVYEPPFDDVLMGGDYSRPTEVTEHSAYGLNLYAGHRTPQYRQGPDLLNEFVQRKNPYVELLPSVVEVLVQDSWGEPIADAELDVFLDHGQHFYHKIYYAEPDFTVAVDSAGVAVLPPEYDPPAPDALRPKPSTTILRVRRNGQWGYGFLPVYYLNVAWIRGQRDRTRVAVRFSFF
jgi:hypothetical protein